MDSKTAHYEGVTPDETSSAGGLDMEKGTLTEQVEKRNSNASQDVAPVTANGTADTTIDMHAPPRVYDDDGQLIWIPARTKDPKDPLNLSTRRKFIGLGALCFFGALAAAAEYVLGAMLPVFELYYAGVDPGPYLVTITDKGGFPEGFNSFDSLRKLPNAPPLIKLYQLATLPILMNGLANLFLIPLAIAIGRRPVLLGCGVLALAGTLWAGFSASLDMHIGARCVQAFGAGTVESLIPFIIQDMVPFHQRNTWIGGIFAMQGLIINGLGIAGTFIITAYDWRYVYHIIAAGMGGFFILVFFTMPETRWHRTKAELRGIPRPDSEFVDQTPRTWRYDLALQQGPLEWKKGFLAITDSLRTFFYPHIFLVTILNSAMIAAALEAIFTVFPKLLTKPYGWKYELTGLCTLPLFISIICVGLISGKWADDIVNRLAKKRGVRVPENQLINLIIPCLASILGCLFFGLAGQDPNTYPWPVFLLGLGLIFFGFLSTSAVGSVYVLESYPQLVGPSLVNIASFRMLIAFALTYEVSDFIVNFGYLGTNMIYLALVSFGTVMLPFVFFYGPAMRKRLPGPNR